jgi:hypothetical protein
MHTVLDRFRAVYGSNPLHLLTLIVGFALLGYVLVTVTPSALWNPNTWWQSILVWFAAAIIAHDLLLFPLYAMLDRILVAGNRLRPRAKASVPVLNYVRIPAMGAALTLLVFLPGIIQQGTPAYAAATGQTQEPFLGRWLLLTAAMFAVSAVVYVIRLALSRRATRQPG